MSGAPTKAPGSRAWSVWAWPAVAVIIVAVAGQLFGLLGAMITAGSAVVALFFLGSEILLVGAKRRQMAILSIVFVLGVITLFTWQGALPWARVSNPASAPSLFQARGERVTADDVRGKNLRGALLAGADFTGLDLRDVQFDGADAPGASFHNANLANASLRGTNLRGADLTSACLQGADLTGAELTGTKIDNASIVLPPVVPVVGTPLPPGQQAPACH